MRGGFCMSARFVWQQYAGRFIVSCSTLQLLLAREKGAETIEYALLTCNIRIDIDYVGSLP